MAEPLSPFELDGHRELLEGLLARGEREGLSLILRAQTRRSRRLVVQNGSTEEASWSESAGIGLHAFDTEGHCAFGAVDGLQQEEGEALLGEVGRAVRHAGILGLRRTSALEDALPYRGDHPAVPGPGLEEAGVERLEKELHSLAEELRRLGEGLRVRVGLLLDREEWRILRSDGTDVRMALPRCQLSATFFAGEAGETVSVRCHVFSPRFDLLSDEKAMATFLGRARSAAIKAETLPRAEHYPAGAYPLVIDYALAKGLAHEAFGHAAESDSFRSSILAENGRFRRGARVGRELVSIVDEPFRGDHADQPVSANGVPRRPVTIVRHGVLDEALADLFSAAPGGVPVRGCGRAESYRHPPLPRMSNIRIEVADPLDMDLPFEQVTPELLRDRLGEAGLFEIHPKLVYLSGYSGGQVNPVKGDFVFNCHALYELTPSSVRLFRPAIFSGPVLEALRAVRAGLGPLQLDALGTCGKWGQSVPSCGGSNYFLVLDRSPKVLVGGR
jgi:TldD protein